MEGISFSLCYSIELLRDFGVNVETVKVGKANLFLGKVFNLIISFTFDATNLGVGKWVVSFNATGVTPWSTNEISVPLALVPLIVLTLEFTVVLVPGVMILKYGLQVKSNGSKFLHVAILKIFNLEEVI